MNRYPRQYHKNLHHMTTIRLSRQMREEAEKKADMLGISFSDFLRQSLSRNIYVSTAIEDEVLKQSAARTIGKSI